MDGSMIIGPVALGGSTDERAGLPKLGEVDGSRDQLTSVWQSGRQLGGSLAAICISGLKSLVVNSTA